MPVPSRNNVIWGLQDPPLTVWVAISLEGQPLTCSYHTNEPWCDHMMQAIQGGHDAEHLWESPPKDLQVPVLPTEGLFQNVSMWEVEDDPNIRQVNMFSDDTGAGIDNFLGFIGPGEGRLALRQLVINWYEVQMASIDKCISGNHGMAAEKEWQANLKSTKKGFVDKWHVIKHKKCKWCFLRSQFSGTDDLVPGSPESEARSFWEEANRAKQARDSLSGTKRARKAETLSKVSGLKNFTPVFSPANKDEMTEEMF